MTRTTNILNLLVALFAGSSLFTATFLGKDYDLLPIICVFVFAGLSFYLNSKHYPKAAYLLFALYINIVISYFTLSHPRDTEMYIYFFPVIVSLVLLNTSTETGFTTIAVAIICAIAFILAFNLDIPQIKRSLTPDQIHKLRTFNLYGASIITATLSFLLTRIIARQFDEINEKNRVLTASKEAIDSSLKEKEVLLAELHHRVKNNLAIISGLLNLQDEATSNIEAKDIIRDSKTRIMSMALVHRMLYERKELKNLELNKYSFELVNELLHSYDLQDKVTFKHTSDLILISVNQAVPLGLIINEAVTNSIKYAFKAKNRNDGTLTLAISKEKDGSVLFQFCDDGPGFPQNFNSTPESGSLGIYLIKSLSEQIDGTVSFNSAKGACITLRCEL